MDLCIYIKLFFKKNNVTLPTLHYIHKIHIMESTGLYYIYDPLSLFDEQGIEQFSSIRYNNMIPKHMSLG